MKSVSRTLFPAAFALAGMTLTSSALAQSVYWINNSVGTSDDGIGRARLDGSPGDFLFRENAPRGLALDAEAGKLYWSAHGYIFRANLDGSDRETVYFPPSDLVWPTGLAIDTDEGTMYWADSGQFAVRRVNVDGSGLPETIVDTSPGSPSVITLDLAAGKIHWGESVSSSSGDPLRIRRAKLDGSEPEDVVTGIPGNLTGAFSSLAVDSTVGKVYWCLYQIGPMNWANLDGSGVDVLVPTFSGSVAIDHVGSVLYWTTFDHVRRGALDSSDVEDVVTGQSRSLSVPVFGLALDLRRPENCDQDRRLTLTDHSAFVACSTGPDMELVRGCGCADANGNGHVSLDDFASLQNGFSIP